VAGRAAAPGDLVLPSTSALTLRMQTVWQRGVGLIREKRLPDLGFWWANRRLLWRQLVPPRAGAWHLVHADPPIVYIMPFGGEVEALAARLSSRASWLLVSNPWIPRGPSEAQELARMTAALGFRYPSVSIVHLCNDAEERRHLAGVGLDAAFCHQNAFLDERIFRVLPDVPKVYDAIYIAQLISYKRHALASRIQRLIIKTYTSEWCLDREYMENARDALRHARWIYDSTDAEVSEAINSCHVGLCLSAAEGGMYASMEYLLCGLPIVTTPSVGGRDVFFDDEYVLTVEPDPRAVREGVAEMIGRRLDPERIRSSTLQRIEAHRCTFAGTVNRILMSCGRTPDFRWGDRFTHKMWRSQDFSLVRNVTSRS
jgi:glycosyltransferase involved in cell wall biosynthesis